MRLLIVHHTPSPGTETLLEAAIAGAAHPELAEVQVRVSPALGTGPAAVLEADAYLLGTPANLGYMSGALKHFFDTIYYPCREATAGRPWAVWVHGENDTGGAISSIERMVTGLGWTPVAAPVSAIGPPSAADRDAVSELAATVAASLL